MASAASPAEGDHAYDLIPPSRRMLTGAVQAAGNFMVVLDLTIANVSIPHISGSLGVTLEQGTWVVTSYAIAEAICVPLTGWLTQRFGAVRLFVMSILGFGLFSLLCGVSTTLGMLVACRIGQGLCGAPIMPVSQMLLLRTFPPAARTKAMAAWAMTITMGPALGPVIGGYISDHVSWHWIFLINVPIALLLGAGSVILLRAVETPRRCVPIDVVGLVLMIVWISSLQIVLDTGRDKDWFADPTILMLAIVATVSFVVFVIWELTDEHPMVDLRVFRHRGFLIAVAVMGFGFGAFFAGTIVVPQWLQTSLGYDATTAGTVSGIHAYVAVLVSFPASRLIGKVDFRFLVLFGMSCMALSMALRAFWTGDAGYWSYALPMAIQGIGIPFMMISLTNLSLSSVEPNEVASAAGLQNFVRTVSLAVAASLSLTIWEDTQRMARTNLVGGIQPEAAQSALAGIGLDSEAARIYIAGLAQNQAVTIAVNHVFAIAAAVMVFASMLLLFAPKPGKAAPGGAGGH